MSVTDILISIHKVYCDGIFTGNIDARKTIEVRLAPLPIPCIAWVYECGQRGCRQVIGTFCCMEYLRISPVQIHTPSGEAFCRAAKLDDKTLQTYLKGRTGYGNIIWSPRLFDKPISLADLPVEKPISRPPQSWQKISVVFGGGRIKF